MKVPRHEYRVVGDAGNEKVAIDVHLRGVTDTSSIVVTIDPPDLVTVLVPDRYHLQLTLSVPISPHAEDVRFKRRTGKLAMLCAVISTTEHQVAAAAEHEQLQGEGAAAEPAQLSAASSGAGRRHQQRKQHAHTAAAAKPGRQVAASDKPVDPQDAAAAWLRLGQEAIAEGRVTPAAIALQKAAQLDPSGNTSARQQLSSQLAALQQQQQKQPPRVSLAGRSQQQAVQDELDMDVPQKLVEIEEKFLTPPRQHSSTLVGRCCAVFDALMLAGVQLGVNLAYWGVSARETKRVPFGPYGNAATHAVTWLGIGLVLLSCIPQLLWQAAWLLPMSWLAATRVCWVPGVHDRDGSFSDKRAATLVEREAMRNKLQDNESLWAGLTKLLLAGISAVFMCSVVWTTFVWEFGPHSVGGWVLEVVLLVWRVVVWLWRLLLWRPPSWYPLQLPLAALHSLNCFFSPAATADMRTFACTTALAPLQIVLTGGGWALVCCCLLSVLWHMGACWDLNWRNQDTDTAAEQPAGKATAQTGKVAAQAGKAAAQEAAADPWLTSYKYFSFDQLPPWWPAAAAGMFPTVVRSWLLLLSHWGAPQAALSAVGAGVEAAVVLLAGGLGGTLSLMQAGLQLMSAACSYSLACVPPGVLKTLGGLLLAALAAMVKRTASWLGWWWVQHAAGAVMGVLTWAAPAWYVGPLVQQACAASGVWQEGCLELLQPYAAQAPDSLSLSHSWWFTLIIQVWVGCILKWLVACRGGEAGGRWLQEERPVRQRQERLEAARQKKEQKAQQRRQQKRHRH